jgi:hypothetical protein
MTNINNEELARVLEEIANGFAALGTLVETVRTAAQRLRENEKRFYDDKRQQSNLKIVEKK